MMYENITQMKQSVLEKAQRKLSNNYPDYEYDKELLGDYFDDAVSIIRKWVKLKNDDSFLNAKYEREIVKFIVESIVVSGMEGQSESYANGIKRKFYANPESNLKASIPQSL